MSDYEMASDIDGLIPSPPLSPFSFVSSARTIDSLSDVESDTDEIDAADVRSISGSEQDWNYVTRAYSQHSVASSAFAPIADGCDSIVSSYRTPSTRSLPHIMATCGESPPSTPRPRSPQLLQLPVSDPSAQPFTLVRMRNLPEYQTLEDLVQLLTSSDSAMKDIFHYSGRAPTPLWISLRPYALEGSTALANSTADESVCPFRSSALIRFMNPEDAGYLSDAIEYMQNQLPQLDDAADSWYWLLDLDVVLISDADAEKGEEDKGLLWISDWLKNDTVPPIQAGVAVGKQSVSELITSILVTPLPSTVRLFDLVEVFKAPIEDGAPTPIRIALLPHLSTHSIFLACCILQFENHIDTAKTMELLSKYDHLLFHPSNANGPIMEYALGTASSTEYSRRTRIEFKAGDWWPYTLSIQDVQIWDDKERIKKGPIGVPVNEDPASTYTWYREPAKSLKAVRSRHARLPKGSNRHETRASQETPNTAYAQPLNSVMLLGLPSDINLQEIVKVYTTPPILSKPTISSAAGEESTQCERCEDLSGGIGSETCDELLVNSSQLDAPVPISISVFESHPTYFTAQRIAVITFDGPDDFQNGVGLLPPSMWYRSGTSDSPCGSFVKPDDCDGTETLFQCQYRYGSWPWIHTDSCPGKTTWLAAEGNAGSAL